jgi:hypothetical protein
VSRATQEYKQELSSFRVRGHYPLGRRFPAASAIKTFCNSLPLKAGRSHLTTPLSEDRGLGFSLFARRYSGYHASRVPSARTYAPTERNSYCSLFLPVLRCFTSRGSHQASVTLLVAVQHCRVSPFGHLRIKGYKPPPRSFSQVSRVLHSRPRPRHPPCTLMSPARRPEYHNYSFAHSRTKTTSHARVFYYLYVFVCQRCSCLLKRKPPHGAVVERLRASGLTAYPLLEV